MNDKPIDVSHQPTPDEFRHKRTVFERLQDMAVQMQRMRRAMGYQWLEGGMTAMEGSETQIVHARQSGLIVVTVAQPSDHLHMEDTRIRPLYHDEFHRRVIPWATDMRTSVAEYRFDEAMLVEKMT